jgi:hypothetical protein
MSDPESGIEVGKTDDFLRLWKAEQGVRLGELRLSNQAAHRTGIETRAASLLGWSVSIALAGTTVALNIRDLPVQGAAMGAACCCAVAALGAGWALWPRLWCPSGADPEVFWGKSLGSELEYLEDTGITYARAIQDNSVQLRKLAAGLRVAWIALAASPLVAGLIALGAALKSLAS